MSIDSAVEKAIKDAVKEEGQPEALASRLIAWFEEMSSLELTATQASEHLDTVRKSINVEAIVEEV
jgi:hypothetical protein